ncbi:MAG: SufD family Fe-S cluster assembly protein [Alistipes sp.]|jgi:Fe-S cluster assembly protein SufD|nr:SufD family Fe-S cluster assembly protein [Alistipes sp.]
MTSLFPDLKEGAAEKLSFPAGEHIGEPLLVESGSRSVRISLSEGARLHLCTFVLSGEGSAQLSLEVELAGPRASFELDGLFVASGRGSASIDVNVRHLHPDTVSRQLVKGIATDEATGTFSGMVYVAPGAQRTDAVQQNRNLQLTDAAHIFTRPGLEIYADDVKCSHGATVGQLDAEALYYMRQRGISEEAARRMQLQGFAAEIIDRCPTEASVAGLAGAAESVRKTVSDRVLAL